MPVHQLANSELSPNAAIAQSSYNAESVDGLGNVIILMEKSSPAKKKPTKKKPTKQNGDAARIVRRSETNERVDSEAARSAPARSDKLDGKGERTRLKILDAAIKQFGDVGYRQTSLASVARSVGLTPAAVYPYFATKHALFLAAGDADASALINKSRSQVDMNMPWASRMRYVLDNIGNHKMLVRIISEEAPELVHECFRFPSIVATFSDLQADVETAQTLGRLRSDIDGELTALGLETIFYGLLLMRVRSGVDDFERRLIGVGVTLLQMLVDPVASFPIIDKTSDATMKDAVTADGSTPRRSSKSAKGKTA
jgi:AcrR family transcriptional regulator